MFDAPDAKERAFASATAVTIVNEKSLAKGVQIIEKQVVDNTIAKIARKDFPFNRFEDDEANTRRDPIAAIQDLTAQLENPRLKIQLEFERVDGVPFMTARVVVGAEKIGKQLPGKIWRHK
jgi:hypothetical protein